MWGGRRGKKREEYLGARPELLAAPCDPQGVCAVLDESQAVLVTYLEESVHVANLSRTGARSVDICIHSPVDYNVAHHTYVSPTVKNSIQYNTIGYT